MKFLEQLKEICDKYDASNGNYPWSRLEGDAVYTFAKKQLTKQETTRETNTEKVSLPKQFVRDLYNYLYGHMGISSVATDHHEMYVYALNLFVPDLTKDNRQE
jgi:hypothetical protein